MATIIPFIPSSVMIGNQKEPSHSTEVFTLNVFRLGEYKVADCADSTPKPNMNKSVLKRKQLILRALKLKQRLLQAKAEIEARNEALMKPSPTSEDE